MRIKPKFLPKIRISRNGVRSFVVEPFSINTNYSGDYPIAEQEFSNIQHGDYTLVVKITWSVVRSDPYLLESNLPNEGYGGAFGRFYQWNYTPVSFELVLGKKQSQVTDGGSALQYLFSADVVVSYKEIAEISIKTDDSIRIEYLDEIETVNQAINMPNISSYAFRGGED